MARAVAQRKQVPYVLIAFVFLFLVAAVMAVLFHMEAQEEKLSRVSLQDALDSYVSEEDRVEPQITRLVEQWQSPPSDGPEPLRVVPQVLKENKSLAEIITGGSTTTEGALKAAKAIQDEHGSTSGLVDMIRTAYQQVASGEDKHSQAVQARRNDTEQFNQQLLAKDTQIETVQNEIAQVRQQLTKAENQLQTWRTEHDSSLRGAQDNWAQQRSDLDKKIAVLTQDISAARADIKAKERQLARLEQQIAQLMRRKREAGVVMAPDGKIVDTISSEIVYINLGKDNGVIPGLTFGVYPTTGKIEDQKGKILVTKVHDTTSECRVLDLFSQRHPITPDDLIMNLAFNEERPYTFVVDGVFDMHGTGQATMAGADEVRSMIKRFGGVVVETVTPGVDYVVMGAEPERPPQPSEDADGTVWKVYQERLKTYEAYIKVKAEAERLGLLPILNANRFMDLVGYKPVQTLRY